MHITKGYNVTGRLNNVTVLEVGLLVGYKLWERLTAVSHSNFQNPIHPYVKQRRIIKSCHTPMATEEC